MSEQTPASSLSEFLRRHQGGILQEWETLVRSLPPARCLSRPSLRDHIPKILDNIAWAIDALREGKSPEPPRKDAETHAHERLEQGFDLAEVVAEYAVLRDVILRHLITEREGEPRPTSEELLLHRAIDQAIATSVDRYLHAQARTLEALDRVSTAYLESQNTDELLQRLLEIFLATATEVDTTVILLHEDNVLRARAAAGLEQEVTGGFSLRVGKGFAGTIAQERRPLLLHDAAADPLVISRAIHERGVRALYGVPLIHENELIGVAHMGSLSVRDFSRDDMRLFDVMTSRATAAIVQHMLRDSLARERARLDAEQQRFVDLVNHLDHAVVWEADAETMRFSFVGEPAEIVSGSSSEGWMCEPNFWSSRVPAEDREELQHTFEHCRSEKGDCRCEHRLIHADGRLRWMHTGIHYTRREGKPCFQGVTVDIGPLKEAISARDEIMAIVSHDLRNPLSAIILNTERIIRDPAGCGERAGANILRSAKRMERLIADLIDIVSVERGQLAIAVEPHSPTEIAREAVSSIEPLVEERGLRLTVEVVPEIPTVHCDRDRILQVLSNLLANAVNVTPRGGSVVLRAGPRSGEVVFSIADTGPGIPEAEKPHLFERYFRGERPGYRGTGLGLAISRGIVTAHGGKIWVESRVGAGSTFFFTLPAQRP